MNELAGQNLGGYLLEEEIGRGSMGIVYRGKQLALGRQVAIKVLSKALACDASYVARFIREAQIIAGLNHPNIVQIFDAGQQNGLLYFVMEHVQGPTIASLLQSNGCIPQQLAAIYAAQIAEALDSAYSELNVIHRDIKPENLMLDRWGRMKIMDFGLARASGLQKITVAKTLVGSVYYASPEQIWGHALDNRSDIYGLGVVLYEMVCGRRPIVGRSLSEITQEIISGTIQPPHVYRADIDPELERTILVAMARNRDERFEQAKLLAQQLRDLPLQAPENLPTAESEASIHHAPNSSAREKIVTRPPGRPQASMQLNHPARPDLAITQPPSSEGVMPPLQLMASPVTDPALADAKGLTSPLHPAMRAAKRRLRRKPRKRRSFWKKLFQNSRSG